MKKRFITLMIFTAAIFFAAASSGYTQEKPAAGTAAAAEPLGENEPIPFMRTEQTAAPEEPSSAGLLLKTLGSMAIIVGLIFAGAWGAKKLGFGNKTPASGDPANLAILTSVSLGNGRTVSTIQFGQRVLLVGSTPQSFTLLAEEDAEPAAEPVTPRSVGELLAEDKPVFTSALNRAESRLNSILPEGKAS